MKSNVRTMANMLDLIEAEQRDQNEPEETSCWSLDRQVAQARACVVEVPDMELADGGCA